MVEENEKNTVTDEEKKIKQQKTSNRLREIYIGSMLRPKTLKWAQAILLVVGFLAFIIFIFVVLLLATRTNADTRQIETLSALAAYSGVALFFVAIFSIIIGFLNVNVRSKAEEEEERARRGVRKIDLELEELDFYAQEIAGHEERDELGERYRKLNRERDLLINQSSQSLERIVSTDWGRILVQSRKRLLQEEERLEARNAANLQYGVLAAVVGVGILIVIATLPFITDTSKIPAFNNIPVYYFSSVPIAIISEVVAIFFLRLFSQTEKSIERNKNEMTNIELRLTAGQLIYYNKDKFDSLAESLAKEERNFVLKKNESSSEFDIDRAVEIATKVIKATK